MKTDLECILGNFSSVVSKLFKNQKRNMGKKANGYRYSK